MKFSVPNFSLLPAALIAALGSGAMAQQSAKGGGLELTAGIALRFEANDNINLKPGSPDSRQKLSTILSFGVLSETRTKRFAFDLGGQFRYQDGSGATRERYGFEKPVISLAYNQHSAAARFEFTASLRETDLSDIPDSVTFLTLDGTRRKALVETRLDLRDDQPLGFGMFARAENVSYGGAAAPLQVGYLRTTVGASARMDINDASQLNINLSHSLYDDDTAGPTRTTNNLTAALNIDRKVGIATGTLGFTDTENGHRVTASVGHSLVLPYGEQSFSLGATRGTTGTVYAIGTLDLAYDLPRGQLRAGLDRRVTNNDSIDSEELRTDLSFSYLQELSALSDLRMDITWSEEAQTRTATSMKNTSIGLTYNYDLAQDWQLSAGYKHKTRQVSGLNRASSNSVFFQIKREIRARY
ncbi:hypothetical protein [Profundibacter sp.]